jgi:hypothetical protein
MTTNGIYSNSSPYYTTNTFGKFLDVLNYRSFPKYADDKVFMINKIYEHKPDLLAYDLYGNPGLWWVFAERNPNVIQDPVGDFIAGTYIQLPSKQTLTAALGV